MNYYDEIVSLNDEEQHEYEQSKYVHKSSTPLLTLDDLIPCNYDEILNDILDHNHTHYIFKGGRGSCKSSFISLIFNLFISSIRF